jgi:hypothetical protein
MQRAAPGPSSASTDDKSPAMTETTPERRNPTSRSGKTLAGAYLDKTDLFIIQELCLRLGRERSQRMTMQEFVVLALTNECERHGVKLTGKS